MQQSTDVVARYGEPPVRALSNAHIKSGHLSDRKKVHLGVESMSGFFTLFYLFLSFFTLQYICSSTPPNNTAAGAAVMKS